MQYWESGLVVSALLVVLLLAAAEVLRRLIPPLGRVGVPGCIIAGVLGLLAGPDVLGLLPMDRPMLESIAYHGLGLLFIAVTLQQPPKGRKSRGARIFAVAIPFMEALQLVVGLTVVLILGLVVGNHLHPGFGLMLPLGFEMGPGQALSLGAAWEMGPQLPVLSDPPKGGMPDGAQVGLIVATFGFGWSIVAGVPLVLWGRKNGLFKRFEAPPVQERAEDAASDPMAVGSLELLTRQIVAIALCYLVTYGICYGASEVMASIPDFASMVWGFHFVIGAVVALAARRALASLLARELIASTPLDTPLLGRLGGVSVDVMTTAALAAIQIGAFTSNWVPIVLVTTAGGAVTLVVCLWLSSRLFEEAPFEHCVVWFGMSTGTLPMGIALLRMVDPELRSPAPLSAALGSAAAIPLAAVVMLVFIPFIVHAWSLHYPLGALPWLGAAALFAVGALLLGRLTGHLRLDAPWSQLWTDPSEDEGAAG